MARCEACGSAVGAGTPFCPTCGAFLDWEPRRPTPVQPAPRQPEPDATSGTSSADLEADPQPVPGAGRAPGGSPPDAAALADAGRRLASAHARPDLAGRLDDLRQRLAGRVVPVAVVGEFKRGKSTLVNALLQTAVCPVDADIVTAVPTFVRYGDEPGATAYREPDDPDGEVVAEPVPLQAVADLVSESGSRGPRLRSVEVRLRHRLLRSGLCLVDTPGVGGLDSAHGVVTLGALDRAEGMLFVTDASQELTAPELAFLRTALERCPSAALVVTKTDLHGEWRRIADLDRDHLRRAGIDIPVLPVSSFLRLRAARAPDLLEESGFPPLAAHLATAVLGRASERASQMAAREVGFVTDQLVTAVEVERQVLTHPERAETVAAGVADTRRRTARLTSAAAGWHQLLADGVQDLVADVEHDLHGRLREIGREGEALVDRIDPAVAWTEVSAWLRREVAAAVVATSDELTRRAEALAADVAREFSLEAGEPLRVQALGTASRLERVTVSDPESAGVLPTRVTTYLMAGRGVAFLPALFYGVASGLLATALLPVVAGLGLGLGAGIGRKVIRDERQRQLVHRRQQAKVAVRRYLDEVGFIVGKDCRDDLRRTQRTLRDEFQARAAALHASSLASAESVVRATGLGGPERAHRTAELDAQAEELRRLRDGLPRPRAEAAPARVAHRG